MREKIGNRPLQLLILTLVLISGCIIAVTIYSLYSTALSEERARLVETVQSQARLIEAVAHFDRLYSNDTPLGSSFEATLSQIRQAHANFDGFAESGEFTLAHRVGDQIEFLLRHRHYDMDTPLPVPFNAKLAEPMRRALSGKSGTIVGLDYRGETVLAAYEPVSEYDMGIVAKIDLAEVQRPFIYAGLTALGVTILLIVIGSIRFHSVIKPMITKLEVSEEQLVEAQRIGNVGNWQRDVVNENLYWSDQVFALFGMQPGEIEPSFDYFLNVIHPDDRKQVIQAIDDAMYRKAEFSIDYRIILPDGEVRWMHEEAVDICDERGNPLRRCGTVQDITARKIAEISLVERNAELQQALATIKTMSGIVPLCAWCSKRIKDDDGEWVPLEKYFEGHTDAHISHGMCPACEEKFKNGKPTDAMK